MQITTRREAIAAGVGQYFTGKPCKHGHISHRYTQSGACAQCISDTSAAFRKEVSADYRARKRVVEARAEKLALIAERQQLKVEAMRGIMSIRLLAHPQDMRLVFDTAAGLCRTRYPVLDVADVYASNKMVAPGSSLYRVPVPIEDLDLMRAISNELWAKHSGIDIQKERERILGAMLAEADNEADEPPEGWQ